MSSKSARPIIKSAFLCDKKGPLKRDEVQCPICWSILIEPVTLPCKHALCLDCFKKHVEETSLQCPCCRMRLSVWSRRAFRDNNLVDLKLWDRIKKEFPKLVETRLCGQDSQALEAEDLISIEDHNNLKDTTQIGGSEDSLLTPRSKRIDGELCTTNGDIRKELEALVKQHEEDIENQRRKEEVASEEFIIQLQSSGDIAQPVDPSVIKTDLELAKKVKNQLDEDYKKARLAEINASRKQFTEPSQVTSKSASASRIDGWMNSSQILNKPGNSSCLNQDSPKSSGKRQSISSLSSRSTKRLKGSGSNTKLSPSSSSTRKSQLKTYSSANCRIQTPNSSQNLILTYLSQNSPSPSPIPCSSFSKPSSYLCDPKLKTDTGRNNDLKSHTVTSSTIANSSASSVGNNNGFSAFSPMKPHRSVIIPSDLVYTSEIKIEPIINDDIEIKIEETHHLDICERDTPTPDSIDLEVNSHFRPIRSAPKTPPKRGLDGSLLPEPLIVKTHPTRPILPVTFLKLGNPVGIMEKQQRHEKSPFKIACLDGKRISEDSGRGSSTPSEKVHCKVKCKLNLKNKKEKSPQIPKLIPLSPFPTPSSSTNGMETPITSLISSENPFDSNTVLIKVEKNELQIEPCTSKSNQILVKIKEEELNEVNESYNNENETLFELKQETGNNDGILLIVKKEEHSFYLEDKVDYSCLFEDSHDSDDKAQQLHEELKRQTEEYERIINRMKQEEDDRKLAEKLQSNLDKGKDIGQPKTYGLRSWVKRLSK